MNSFVFFGSGPVAAKSLSLLAASFQVEAIITKPSTVKEMSSIVENVPVHSVQTKSELDALLAEQAFSSPVGVLIDFGIIVSQTVIDYFPKGIVNSHFSLLPELRGADPISFAILEGRQQTGVSLMLLVPAMDEGPLLAQSTIDIDEGETTPTLTEKLINLSDQMLKATLPLWLKGEIVPADQIAVTVASKTPTYTRKLTKADGIIDWTKPAIVLEREIRAYTDWPKSRTMIGGIDCVITKAYAVPSNDPSKSPGDAWIIEDIKMLAVETAQGYLCIEKIKPAGKKEMTAQAFLAGYRSKISV